jgi:hypothetical protein
MTALRLRGLSYRQKPPANDLQKGVTMTHDAETETAAAVIEDLLYPLRTRGGQIN